MKTIKLKPISETPHIYVAHSYKLTDWVEKEVIPKLRMAGFIIKDPFENRREWFKDMTYDEVQEESNKIRTPRWPVTHDLRLIDHCDGVIVLNNGGPSYGSAFEAFYAAHVKNLPVVFVTSKEHLEHPWLNFYCVCVTEDVDHAISNLAGWFDIA